MLPSIRRALLAAALVATLPALARAQAADAAARDTTVRDTAKVLVIREILTELHAVDQAMSAMEAAIPLQRAANPAIPAVFWDRVIAEAHAHRGDFEEIVIRVYSRHFTTDELRQLLAFYRSPIGKRMIQEQPAVLRESTEAGQQWGFEVGRRVGRELAAEGALKST